MEVKYEDTADLACCAAHCCGCMVPESGMDEAHSRICLGRCALSRCVATLHRIPAEARGGICQRQPGGMVQAISRRYGLTKRAALREPPGVRRGGRRHRAGLGLLRRPDGPDRTLSRTQLWSGHAMDELRAAGLSCAARPLDAHLPRGARGAGVGAGWPGPPQGVAERSTLAQY